MTTYQIIFFVLSVLAALPVLVYYYRRSPNPRCRPSLGEMSMVSMFAFLICFTGSYFLGSVLDDPEQFKLDEGLTTIDFGSGGVGEEEEDASGAKKKQPAERRFERSFDRPPKNSEGGGERGGKGRD